MWMCECVEASCVRPRWFCVAQKNQAEKRCQATSVQHRGAPTAAEHPTGVGGGAVQHGPGLGVVCGCDGSCSRGLEGKREAPEARGLPLSCYKHPPPRPPMTPASGRHTQRPLTTPFRGEQSQKGGGFAPQSPRNWFPAIFVYVSCGLFRFDQQSLITRRHTRQPAPLLIIPLGADQKRIS